MASVNLRSRVFVVVADRFLTRLHFLRDFLGLRRVREIIMVAGPSFDQIDPFKDLNFRSRGLRVLFVDRFLIRYLHILRDHMSKKG